MRLYELLRSYVNRKTWFFEVGTGSAHDIHRLLGRHRLDKESNYIPPASWRNWKTFERDVLQPAQSDFKKYADITFTYDPLAYDMSHHATRGIRCVRFKIQIKTQQQRDQSEQAINAIYHAYIDDWCARHLPKMSYYPAAQIYPSIFVHKFTATTTSTKSTAVSDPISPDPVDSDLPWDVDSCFQTPEEEIDMPF